MDGEIDSLTQVTTVTSGNSNELDNNYLSTSFGAGGRGSQLVEPGFRAPVYSEPDPTILQPASSTPFSTPAGAASFSDLAKTTSSYSSNMIIASTLNDYGPIPNYLPPLPSEPPPPLPQQRPLQPPQLQATSVSSHTVPAANYMSSTGSSNFVVHNKQPQQPHRTINLPHLPTPTSSTMNTASTITLHPTLYAQPTSSTIHHHQTSTPLIPSSLPHRSNSNHQAPVSSISATRLRNTDAPIYSPPPPSRSPPLDQLMSSGGAAISSTSNANPDASLGRIPKKSNNTVRDEYNDMNMVDLLALYSATLQKRTHVVRRREDLEKSINDRMRNCQGKNIELDSKFRELKDCQRKTKDELDEVNATIKKIKHKLSSKYNHHVEEPARPLAPVVRPNLARMSTASRTPYNSNRPLPASRRHEPESPGSNRKRFLLKLNTDNVWCKLCDIHFDTFKEYCEHLHKRDHVRNMKRTDPPWRRNKETLNKIETYDVLKSICAKASKDCEEFSLQVYDDVLNTNMDNRTAKLKELIKKRERRNFQDDDPLFGIKGYQNIIPITGFFCQLCDTAFCDATAIEQHVTGENHNLKHALAVATDAASERTFRQMLDKSYRKQHPDDHLAFKSIHNDPPRPSSAAGSSSSNKTGTASSSLTRIGAQPIQKYKKPTSHIVDQHDVIKNKFENRPEPAGNNADLNNGSSDYRKTTSAGATNGKHKRIMMTKMRSESPVRDTSPPSPPPPPKRRDQMPEIVPVGEKRNEPMLQRLKVPPRKPPATIKNLELNKSGDEEEEEEEEVQVERNLVKKTESMKKNNKKAYFSSDTSTNENDDDEVQILSEFRLEAGDPNSPWPDLDLKITGNAHWDLLKDPRLAKEPRVVLNRINIEDYKDMLMDSSTYWTRIVQLMTKKEDKLDQFKKILREKPAVRKTYFDKGGKAIPVQIDDDDDYDDGGKRKRRGSDSDDDKEDLRRLIGGETEEESRGGEKKQESKGGEQAKDDIDVLSNESDTDQNFQMSFLENFFCETKDTNNRD